MAVRAQPEPPRVARTEGNGNRERVLQAARAEFDVLGLEAQMDPIAIRAKVGVATIYRLFRTKEALFEAVVFADLQLLAQVGRPLVDDNDPALALYGFLGHLVEAASSSAAIRDALAGKVELGPAGDRALRDLETVIAALLMRAQLRHDARDDVGAAEVLALLSAIVGSQERAASGVQVDNVRLLGLVCAGLRMTAPVPAI